MNSKSSLLSTVPFSSFSQWDVKQFFFTKILSKYPLEELGKAAIFNSDETYTYASYLIRYRFDTTIVLPEYVNILFMTPLVREQIAVMRRQGGGQYNLNSDEIGAIRLPVPSIPIQKQIIKKFFDAKDEAQIYYDAATKCQIEAAVNFEKEIFS